MSSYTTRDLKWAPSKTPQEGRNEFRAKLGKEYVVGHTGGQNGLLYYSAYGDAGSAQALITLGLVNPPELHELPKQLIRKEVRDYFKKE